MHTSKKDTARWNTLGAEAKMAQKTEKISRKCGVKSQRTAREPPPGLGVTPAEADVSELREVTVSVTFFTASRDSR